MSKIPGKAYSHQPQFMPTTSSQEDVPVFENPDVVLIQRRNEQETETRF